MHLILIVDDHRDTVRLVARLLRHSGFDTATADGGAAALDYLRTAPVRPSLVLLDVMMPGMDGFQTLEAIRSLPTVGSQPVVVMFTALAEEEHRERAAQLGAAGYWIKGTFDPAKLGDMINQHLGRPEGKQPIDRP